MDLGGVLVESRGDLVLGLLDGHAVDMVDLLADGVVGMPMGRARQEPVPGVEIDIGRCIP